MSGMDEKVMGTRDFAPAPSHVESDNEQSPPGSKDGDIYDTELGPRATYINTGDAAGLSQEHRDYLIQRHGTLDLDPIPSMDPADPYNWPSWKKNANLFVVAFQSCMTTFIAAAIIPAYANIAADYNTTITRTSYLTSLQICVLGFSPLFWKPIMNRYGRRPVWLLSTFVAGCFNIGCALSPNYTSMAICRAFVSFFLSPAYVGSAVVTETFFKRERGKKMGMWTLLVTLGPPSGPFLMGFVAYRVSWRWILWICAIVNFCEFIVSIFLAPETRYLRKGVTHAGTAFKQEYMTFKRIDPAPFKPMDFIQPFFLAKYGSILIPAIAYAIVFNFASVLLTVEIPSLFLPKFGFNDQQLGLQFLGIIIGSIIGEQLGGRSSDLWMKFRAKKAGHKPKPESRLWLSYPGFTLVIVGLIVFFIQLNNLKAYNITPVIGLAITACGNQIITTVLVTYAVDSHPEQSASIGVFVNVVRQTWAFIGPFWFPYMFASLGIAKCAGVTSGVIVGASVIPIAVLHFLKGRQHRRSTIDETEVSAGPRQ